MNGFLRIQEIAKQQGLNITTLSRKAEIAYGTAYALWNDRAEQYSQKTLVRIARALGVEVSDLFAENAAQKVID